jgi:hypothetical protein
MPEHDSELEADLRDFQTFIIGGSTPADAELRLKRFIGAERAGKVHAEYLKRNQRFIDLRDPRVLRESPEIETWYPGPDHDGAWCWPRYKALVASQGWDPEDLAALDVSSTKVMAHLEHPGRTFATRGLVVGYVQSGKTANYAALIAKAADVGYRLFIVLAGTTSSLRRQTQDRLDSDVFAHHSENWTSLTSSTLDFGSMPGNPNALLHPRHPRSRVVCVVKKNARILERLHRFLSSATRETLEQCPALVIDDEADNASINTRYGDAQPTAINRLIKANLELLPKAAYVGYTATPFANIFIDPTSNGDLFPRDFIADLPRPRAYFGSENIFGRDVLNHDESGTAFEGLPLIRTVSEPDEPAMLKPARAADREAFEVELPDSLKEAIQYFLLATACRYARGQDGDHSSMLVHTSQYVAIHTKTRAAIADFVGEVRRAVAAGDDGFLRELWAREMSFTSQLATGSIDYEQLRARLPLVFERCAVVVDNGLLGSQLVYPKKSEKDPRVYVAVGGNTLSRGLTLEGLIVSYFIRVASAYDTLLQMGRWFGYRRRYEDLPRLWMTDELRTYFYFLAGVEEEFRHDIRRLERERRKPTDLQVRVRTHSTLQITSKAKMGTAELSSASYSDTRLQTTFFEETNVDWLRRNIEATKALLSEASRFRRTDGLKAGSRVYREIEASIVETFLRDYAFHGRHEDLKTDLLLGYLHKEQSAGSLMRWNVAIVGRSQRDEHLGELDLGTGEPVPCINRSRYQMMAPCNIKALTSPIDRIIDLEKRPGSVDDEQMVELRNEQAPGIGLLLIYPISKDSAPVRAKPEWTMTECLSCHEVHWCPGGAPASRHPLHAAEHVVGVGVVLPTSILGDQSYVANALVFSGEEDLDDEVARAMESEVDQ